MNTASCVENLPEGLVLLMTAYTITMGMARTVKNVMKGNLQMTQPKSEYATRRCTQCRNEFTQTVRSNNYLCKECRSKYQKKWTAKRRALGIRRIRKCPKKDGYFMKYFRRPENVHKLKCKNTFQNAKNNGYIKPEPCAICFAEKTEAHHEDYTKPFHIIWLCLKCHKDIHRSKRAMIVYTPRTGRSRNGKRRIR